MNLRQQLTRDEGKKPRPYADQYGNTTIGIGRNLQANPLSEDEIEYLFNNDLKRTLKLLFLQLPWAEFIDDVRRNALVNMAFNMGVSGLIQNNPEFLSLMEQKKYTEAAKEILNGNWKYQVKDRAYRISEQIETGVMI